MAKKKKTKKKAGRKKPKTKSQRKPGPVKDRPQSMLDGDRRILVHRQGDRVYAFHARHNGKKFVDIQPVKHVVRHSPDGFQFGYAGSGPHDLSLSILVAVLGEPAEAYYNAFTRDVVSQQTKDSWGVSAQQVWDWYTAASKHTWQGREVKQRSGQAEMGRLRCTRCGTIKRPDGKDGPCPVGPE